MSRAERNHLRARLRDADLTISAMARQANIRRARLYDFFAMVVDITPAEIARFIAVIEAHETCLADIRRLVA